MGRKKRKIVVEEDDDDEEEEDMNDDMYKLESNLIFPDDEEIESTIKKPATNIIKSSDSEYALTSHSGELVEEDIYISDGSSDEEDAVEVMLTSSKLGLMRRGLHHPLLLQPNRQWNARLDQGDKADPSEDNNDDQEVDDLSKLDPAQRAERLLREKQRKLEEAKLAARRMESEENAGRDPCLFSKRTAFDIRMDQIEEKPWTRGTGDVTDFFNYNMTEEDWLEYSRQQLLIRQELTDASRQRRPPDPTIVPVQARAPSKQTPKVAVNPKTGEEEQDMDGEGPMIGPIVVEGKGNVQQSSLSTNDTNLGVVINEPSVDISYTGIGGAWGAGAAPGSTLAKLIEEQEKKNSYTGGGASVSAAPASQLEAPNESVTNNQFVDPAGSISISSGNYYGDTSSGAHVTPYSVTDYPHVDQSNMGGTDYGNYTSTSIRYDNEGGVRGSYGGGGGGDNYYSGGRSLPPTSSGGWRGRGRSGGGRGRGRGGFDLDYQSRKRGREDYGGRY
jgi:Fip1 motif